MKKIKNEKAITLIALVITIIVLLILAGVAISMLTGNNGILKKAVEAKESTEDAQVREQIQLAVASARMINNGDLTDDALDTELKNTFGEGKYTLTKKTDEEGNQTGFLVKVGDVEEHIEEKIVAKPIIITAADVNADIIGATVTNYKPEADQETEWRIFFADNEHIYLIAKDYISIDKFPETKQKHKPDKGNYGDSGNLSSVYEDYTNWAEMIKKNKLQNSLTTYHKWASKEDNQLKDYENIKSVAYMLDTEIWTKQYGTDDAEYVIGGPTIEMFCKSYNTKGGHERGKETIEFNENYDYGYGIRFGNSGNFSDSIGLNTTEYDNLFILDGSNNRPRGFLIASPSNDYYDYMISVEKNGNLGNNDVCSSLNYGFRPLVCLKSNVQLQEIEKGTKYEIIN